MTTLIGCSTDWNINCHTHICIYMLMLQSVENHIYIYYEFSLLHKLSLVLQPLMSAYIRKTDGVYIWMPRKRYKHGRQNITLHWINGIIRNNKCIFYKIKSCCNTQNGCMNKNILQQLIPSQIPDRSSKFVCFTAVP